MGISWEFQRDFMGKVYPPLRVCRKNVLQWNLQVGIECGSNGADLDFQCNAAGANIAIPCIPGHSMSTWDVKKFAQPSFKD